MMQLPFANAFDTAGSHYVQGLNLAQTIKNGNRAPVLIEQLRHHLSFLDDTQKNNLYAISGLREDVYTPERQQVVGIRDPNAPDDSNIFDSLKKWFVPEECSYGDSTDCAAAVISSPLKLISKTTRKAAGHVSDGAKGVFDDNVNKISDSTQKLIEELAKNKNKIESEIIFTPTVMAGIALAVFILLKK